MKFGQAGEERSIFVSKRRYDSRYKFGTTEREKKSVVLQVSNADKFVAERLLYVLRLPNRKGCR